VHRESTLKYSNKLTLFVQYFIPCRQLYMFRVKHSPIIKRSNKLQLQHLVVTNSMRPAVVVDDSELSRAIYREWNTVQKVPSCWYILMLPYLCSYFYCGLKAESEITKSDVSCFARHKLTYTYIILRMPYRCYITYVHVFCFIYGRNNLRFRLTH
jgi:hypothetical protein